MKMVFLPQPFPIWKLAKMNKSILFLILTIGASFCYSQEYSKHYLTRKAQFESSPETENEIIFLGNSITEGGAWKEMFKKHNVLNRGISGDVTLGILNRLDEVVSSKPSSIFLLIGINDLARGKSTEHVTNNIEKIIKHIQSDSPNTILYLQTILPVNPYVGKRFASHKNKQNSI